MFLRCSGACLCVHHGGGAVQRSGGWALLLNFSPRRRNTGGGRWNRAGMPTLVSARVRSLLLIDRSQARAYERCLRCLLAGIDDGGEGRGMRRRKRAGLSLNRWSSL